MPAKSTPGETPVNSSELSTALTDLTGRVELLLQNVSDVEKRLTERIENDLASSRTAYLDLLDRKRQGLPTILPEEKILLLRTPLPIEALRTNTNNPELSSIKAIFVIERLNEVFGIAGWTYTTEIIENPVESAHVVVKGTLCIPEYGIVRESYGGNSMVDRGDAFKSAATDALTKIGSTLYIGMDVFKGHGPTLKNGGRGTPVRTEAKTTIAAGAGAVTANGKKLECEDCKKEIKAHKAADGENYSPEQQVQVSRTRKEWLKDLNVADSGPDLCGSCQRLRRQKTQQSNGAAKPAVAPIR